MAEKECDCLCPRCVRLFAVAYWAEEWARGRITNEQLMRVIEHTWDEETEEAVSE